MTCDVSVLLKWGSRVEDVTAIGERLCAAVHALEPIVARMGARWYEAGKLAPLDVPDIAWADLVARWVSRDDRGPIPEEGYNPTLAAVPAEDDTMYSTRGFTVFASDGSPIPAGPRLVQSGLLITFDKNFDFESIRRMLKEVFVDLLPVWRPDCAAVAARPQIREAKTWPGRDALTPRIGGLSWVSDRIGGFPEHVDGATAQAVHGGRLLIADGWPDESSLTPEAARRIRTSLTAQGWNARMTPMQQQ